jgi:hypothetical protein
MMHGPMNVKCVIPITDSTKLSAAVIKCIELPLSHCSPVDYFQTLKFHHLL